MLFRKKIIDLSDDILLEIINYSLEGVIIATGALPKIIFANKAFERTFGYSREELKTFSPLQVMGLVHPDDREMFFKRYRRRLAGDEFESHYEFRAINKNKKVRWVELSSHRIKYKGEFAIQANFLDVTEQHEILDIQRKALEERIKLENTIRDSELRFRGAFENSSVGMAIVAPDGHWLKVNKVLCKILGFSEKELLSKNFKSVTHPDDVPKTIQFNNELISGKKDYGYLEKRYITKSKKIIWVLINVTAIRNEKGEMLYYITQTQNITTQHESIKAQQELTKKYEIATNITGQVFYEYDIKTGKIKWFGPIKKVLGYTISEFQKVNIKKWGELIHPEDRPRAIEILEKAENTTGHYICEYHFKKKNGDYIAIYDEGSFFHDKETNKVRMLGSMRDISQLKRAQEEVIQKENLFKKVVTSTPVVTFVVNREGVFTLSEGLGLYKLGLKPGQVIGQSVYDVYKDYPDVKDAIRKALKGKDFNYQHKIGKLFFSTSYTPLKDEEGKIIGLIGVATDITDQKNTEATIRAERAKDEALLKAIPDGVIAVNQSNKIVFVNDAAKEKLKIQSSEVIGKPLDKIWKLTYSSGKELPPEVQPLYMVHKYKKKVEKTIKDDIYYTDPAGNRFPVYVSANPILIDQKMSGVINIFRDITMEKEVDRMKSEFVSLSSHQLRTPITSINWLTETLLDEKNDNLTQKQRKTIEEIRFGNNRMIDLVNALLNVARLEIGTFMITPEIIHLEEACNSVLRELGEQIKTKKIHIKRTCPGGLKEYRGDPRLLSIILENLLSNAIKYSKENGVVKMGGKLNKDYLIISINDTGIGIPEDQQSKIFTKLFRADNAQLTNPDGSGLGLYIVKLIIDAVNGKIWFKSKEGIGTTFYVALPRRGMKKKEGTKVLI